MLEQAAVAYVIRASIDGKRKYVVPADATTEEASQMAGEPLGPVFATITTDSSANIADVWERDNDRG